MKSLSSSGSLCSLDQSPENVESPPKDVSPRQPAKDKEAQQMLKTSLKESSSTLPEIHLGPHMREYMYDMNLQMQNPVSVWELGMIILSRYLVQLKELAQKRRKGAKLKEYLDSKVS